MRAARLLSVILLALALAGCWGSRETDDLAYVLVVGFDKGPDRNVIVTFQIANPIATAGTATGSGGGGGGGQSNEPLITTSIVQRLPLAAFNLANVERSREISLLHTAAYVFSEELAREGIGQYLLPVNRFRETRGTALVLICRGKARDFIEKHKPKLEASPAKLYQHLIGLNRVHGLSVTTQYSKFYSQLKSGSVQPTAPLAAISEKAVTAGKPQPDRLGDYLAGNLPSNKGEAQFLGAAVFRGDKMVGAITGDETRYLNMLTGNIVRSFIAVRDPKSDQDALGITLRQARKPVVKVRFTPERPVIDVEVFVEPDISGLGSGINYESVELKPVLEKKLKDLFEQRCRQLVAKSQEEYRSDIFSFGHEAKKQFLTVQEWRDFNWSEAYPRAEVNVKVNVKVRRTGLMVKTSPVRD